MKSISLRAPGSDSLFERSAIEALSFLCEQGFTVVEHSPTLVRFGQSNVEIDIYQGRQSYEIGAGIAINGIRFALSELIRVQDPDVAEKYRNPVATDVDGVVCAVTQVASTLRQYVPFAWRGDNVAIAALAAQRKAWAIALELDVLAEQTRPLADLAFKAGDYATAAKLYARIRSRLSTSEQAKLALCQARSATRH